MPTVRSASHQVDAVHLPVPITSRVRLLLLCAVQLSQNPGRRLVSETFK